MKCPAPAGDESAVTWTQARWIPSLDAIRGIAALAVVVHHTFQARSAGTEGTVTSLALWLGSWGVTLFWVLSGFCIHLPQARRFALGNTAIDWRAFYYRRARRLLPTHYASLVCAVIAAAYFPSALITPATLETFVAHVGMVHTWVPGATYSINAVFWSIAIEAHFYMLYPVFLWLRERLGSWVVLVLFVVGGGFSAGAARFLDGEMSEMARMLFITTWWQWALGALLADIYVRGRAGRLAWLVSFRGAAPLWGAASLAFGLWDPVVGFLHLRSALFPVTCALLLASLLLRPGRPAWVRAGEPLGQFSYSLYLMHPVALALLLHAPLGDTPAWLSMVIDTGAALLLSGGFYWVVERHFVRPPQTSAVPEPRLLASDPA